LSPGATAACILLRPGPEKWSSLLVFGGKQSRK
jgi:hypothetical protein